MLLPLLGSPLLHAPVLRYDLLRGLKRPLDGGRTVRGRRLFGDNKTWRGALVMTAGVVGASGLLWRAPRYRARLPAELRDADPLLVGGLLGAAMVVGELPNSLLKRQLGIEPGKRGRSVAGIALAVWDQADFVPVLWLFLRPVWRMRAVDVAEAAAIVLAVHIPINVIGYAIGARTSPV